MPKLKRDTIEERFEKKFARVQSDFHPRGGKGQKVWVCKLDEFGRVVPHNIKDILTFIKAELKARDKEWERRIRKAIPERRGFIPTAERVLSDLLQESKKVEGVKT